MSFLQVVGVTIGKKIDIISAYQLRRGVNSHRFFLSCNLQADRASAGLVSARSQILLLDILDIISNCQGGERGLEAMERTDAILINGL